MVYTIQKAKEKGINEVDSPLETNVTEQTKYQPDVIATNPSFWGDDFIVEDSNEDKKEAVN